MAKTPEPPQGGEFHLALPPVDEIAESVKRGAEEAAAADREDLARQADTFVRDLLEALPDEDAPAGAARQREVIDYMGIEVQRQAARRSAMLQEPIRKLAHQGEEGGPVARTLLDLRQQMSALDPRGRDLAPGLLDRLLARIPGVGTKVQRYFRQFETAQQALDAIIRDLETGARMLRRDNLTLSDDQAELREVLAELASHIELGKLIDARLVAAAEALPETAPRRAFIEEELLFPLRQRIVDLQQQQAVSQQGVLALEVVIRNNRELIRGVDRAINVTVSALNVAVTVALGLANQRLVLDRVEGLNRTTSDMIAGTAQALRRQGAEIQTRAAATMLDMEQLEAAFEDVLGAIDALSRYRQEALPRLDEQIDRLDTLARRGQGAIERLEQGNQAWSEDEAPDAGEGEGGRPRG
ncbi:toxic anion resistance protein [Alkalilimnicola ehrlichii MLHE-1]|uniref:Toxic anion resistance family protein n=1 Tax=Alkalilimnicola ehrlichii (strain ATCC BAA-1101 / DSM 17681 / MLHE-1) TaxID=187272 RepID=Q0A8H0_ALKEH|nr:toxic anion resistance protein [Alkalilimnicola ehrlichii]ABI56867.1 toxic anion resistance family protein [Alkalilimnicola ehrlichii MLHE-1]